MQAMNSQCGTVTIFIFFLIAGDELKNESLEVRSFNQDLYPAFTNFKDERRSLPFPWARGHCI